MSELREAAKMALEALKECLRNPSGDYTDEIANEAIEALRTALAQPEQEPVAWLDSDGFPWSKEGVECRSVKDTYTPLYAGSPPIKEQQPVAWRYKIVTNCWTYSEEYPNKELAGDAWGRWNVTPLYTAPPKREWVGLTDEERVQAFVDAGLELAYMDYDADMRISSVIEAKLKEKNFDPR